MPRSGRRMFMRMMSARSWLISPRRYIFSMGICTPSEKMSLVMPSSVPPISAQCAMQAEKPMIAPPSKIGTTKVMWLRWLPVV